MSATDRVFAGSMVQLYDEYMVPMIFAPYAADLAARVVARRPSRVLEVAAGTGVVTRALANTLPGDVELIATDLNPAMLERAAAVGTCRPVQWLPADAMHLPFADASFDAVLCQFGAMFFPDKPQAFAEARRVLRPGGAWLFNVWDALEYNQFADTVVQALQQVFPDDPPRFMARVPHGYSDLAVVLEDLVAGGFSYPPYATTLSLSSHAPSARQAAVAYCQGTPQRGEIEARDPARLQEATDAACRALEQRFGTGAVQGKIQAHIFVAER